MLVLFCIVQILSSTRSLTHTFLVYTAPSFLLKKLWSINHKALGTASEYHLINKLIYQLTEQLLGCYSGFNQTKTEKTWLGSSPSIPLLCDKLFTIDDKWMYSFIMYGIHQWRKSFWINGKCFHIIFKSLMKLRHRWKPHQ